MIRIGSRSESGSRSRFGLGSRSGSDPSGAGCVTMPAPWERGLSEAEFERRGVCDGTDASIVGEEVAGAEFGRYEVCDSTNTMGVGAMGGRVQMSFRKKFI